MATFTFNGAISGLDTTSIMNALIATEKLPLQRLQVQRSTYTSQATSYGDLRSLLAKLESAGKAFTRDLAGAKRTASSSNASVMSATASTAADAASYNVTVVKLATSTRATSTTSIGTAITEAADAGSLLSTLKLPGAITGGSVGMVVDGRVVRATIGDPAATTLRGALDAIGAALTMQIRANEGGGSATVSAAIVDNRIQLSLSGTTEAHSLSFGIGGDTSNALGILGLSGSGTVSLSSAAPMTGRTALGVVQTSTPLQQSGLAGLDPGAPGATETLTINGTAITYDTSVDSLSTLIGRINASTAGVVATLDRTNDRVVITSKTGGAAQLAIEDTGALVAALHLDTADAQLVGRQAELTVDGRTYFSDTNKVSTAISGVTLSLLSEGSSTVTVNADQEGLASALKDVVSAYNGLADKLDSLAANEPKKTRGVLAGDSDVRSLALNLRRRLMGDTAVTGRYTSMTQIGLNTGAVGAAVGSTDRLQLDETRLKAALAEDPGAVANLLNNAAGAISQLVTYAADWTKSGGRIDKSLERLKSSQRDLDFRETQIQARIEARQAALEKKFAAMEKTLAQLQTESSAVGQQVSSLNG
jgi:flagellar hook-associated protein 2